jgi:metal-dependent amidase/aminoacylase/carboxypeptidase family protein
VDQKYFNRKIVGFCLTIIPSINNNKELAKTIQKQTKEWSEREKEEEEQNCVSRDITDLHQKILQQYENLVIWKQS